MDIDVRIATAGQSHVVAEILAEASAWADTRGVKLWQLAELDPQRLAAEVNHGLFFLAWCAGDAAGTVKFQLDNPEFWPDDPARMRRTSTGWRYGGVMRGHGLDRAHDRGRTPCASGRPSAPASGL